MNLHKIKWVKFVSKNTFIVRMERKGMEFTAGQYIQVGIPDDFVFREYSIYSPEQEDYLEILVKHIKNGYFTNKLVELTTGDLLEIQGPFGEFTLKKNKIFDSKYLFIATGTGIAPFHSMVATNPGLNYRIVHGVSYDNETYGKKLFNKSNYLLCTSKDKHKSYIETVTNYLFENDIKPFSYFYLCGNNKMITDGIEILREKGYKRGQFYAEAFY